MGNRAAGEQNAPVREVTAGNEAALLLFNIKLFNSLQASQKISLLYQINSIIGDKRNASISKFELIHWMNILISGKSTNSYYNYW